MTPLRGSVTVLTTGGTIGQVSQADGRSTPTFEPASLAASLDLPDVHIEFLSVMHKGSKDIVPDDWVVLANAVADVLARDPNRGVVVLHGTDTLHFTSAALSLMLSGIGVPIVLTGSMIPGGDVNSDARENLRDAVSVAAFGDLAEVCVVFSADRQRSGSVIIRGSRARKVHSYAIDAFASVNAPPLGQVVNGDIAFGPYPRRHRRRSTIRANTSLDQNVVLVKATPALTESMLTRMLAGTSGAVLEGTGVGHIKSELHDVIADYAKPVVISTQAWCGGERLGSYKADERTLALPNVVQGGSLTSESALVSLMWALGQEGDSLAQVKETVSVQLDASQAETGQRSS